MHGSLWIVAVGVSPGTGKYRSEDVCFACEKAIEEDIAIADEYMKKDKYADSHAYTFIY